MVVIHSPQYHINIGTHVFPTAKYGLLRDRLMAAGLEGLDFVEAEPASWEDVALVHTPDYLDKLRTGRFTVEEQAQLELPWSPDVVEGFRMMTGGTLQAARLAMKPGPISFHLGGGLHHAFANHGEGFCVFNDVAVAIRVLFRDGLVTRCAVVDLDVHHGNGTAFIFAGDPRVFTFSMHQESNYPAYKPRGSLDIGLGDGTGDQEYLDRLTGALPQMFDHRPDVVLYLAGGDPYKDDQLGGLSLTQAGLRQRDRLVLQDCRRHGVPAVVLLAGGYARKLEDTIDIHYATVEEALRSASTRPPSSSPQSRPS